MTSKDHFTPCSAAPHCVSSQAPPNNRHHVPPLGYRGSAQEAHRSLHAVLARQPRVTIVTDEPDFIHATFRTWLGFIDDVYFLIEPDRHVVDVKSSSRLGYYDFGVNRRRVERLRNAFTAQMAAERSPHSSD